MKTIATSKPNSRLDIVFDGPPSHESGRFVEVEDYEGRSVNAGEWIKRDDGLWALRITVDAFRAPNRHSHVAGTMVGEHTDECAYCGHDLRRAITNPYL